MTEAEQNEVRLLLARLASILEKSGPQSRRETRQQAGLLTRQEMARRLGVGASTLAHDTGLGLIPPPRHKAAGGKLAYYSEGDVAELASYFAARPGHTQTDIAARRREAGFFSRADVAARCGVATITIMHHERQGRFSPPARKWPEGDPNARYYSEGEARAIEKVLRERKGFALTGRRGKRAA